MDSNGYAAHCFRFVTLNDARSVRRSGQPSINILNIINVSKSIVLITNSVKCQRNRPLVERSYYMKREVRVTILLSNLPTSRKLPMQKKSRFQPYCIDIEVMIIRLMLVSAAVAQCWHRSLGPRPEDERGRLLLPRIRPA